MFKILLITILGLYILTRVSRFLFGWGRRSESSSYRDSYRHNRGDRTPGNDTGQGKVKGGEYIDFEEIK